MAKKVIAAMSGGVDSAVAAYLLKEQGFDVIGVTLRLAPDVHDGIERTGRCCSIDDMTDARHVCMKLGIPFYAIDAQENFKKAVFDPFVKAYDNGVTPIPCLACNHTVKFGDLFKTAQNLGAELATGHYARIVEYGGQKTIARPFDIDRDQTYYLYGTSPDIIEKLHFPLGDISKPKVREIARHIGLLVHDKKDSHEICFVPDGNHARVVERALKKTSFGSIVNEQGEKLGSHHGIHQFTVGQRRGLGIAHKERLFVADIDKDSQTVVLAGKSSLQCSLVKVTDMRVIIPLEAWPNKVQVKVRARSEAINASMMAHDQHSVKVSFDEPVSGVALGQAAVFYDGEVMLGGGILCARLDGAFPRETQVNF